MPEIPDYVERCKSCEKYKESGGVDPNAIAGGTVTINDKKIEWVLVPSDKKAAERHYILTTVSHHIGEEMVDERAVLNASATRVASKILGPHYRLINNSGEKASSITHYHCHLIAPGKGERLPKAVANVQKVLQDAKNEFGLPDNVIDYLDEGIIQQK